MTYYTRDQWSHVGASFQSFGYPPADGVVHHTGGDGPGAFDPGYLRAIENYEMTRADALNAIAYHRITFDNGDCAEGRPFEVMSGATYTWNDRSLAVCAVGNFQNYDPSNACVDEICNQFAWAIQHGLMRPGPRIRFHGQMPNNSTACAGNGLNARIEEIANRVGGVAVLEPGVPPGPLPSWPSYPRLGQVGPDVAAWQNLLVLFAGANIAIDGDFGPMTDEATRTFQSNSGLAADGIVGPDTNQAMAELIAFIGQLSGAPPPPGFVGVPPWPGVYLINPTSGGGTAQWQQQMANRGWMIDVDDQYGPNSERVCMQFQAEKGLGVDGVVGPITWDASWSAPVT